MVLVRVSATQSLLEVAATPDMRVKDLKQALYETHAYPIKKQKLTVNGKKLKDGQSVSDKVNPDKDIVDLSVGMAGGCIEMDCCCCECCI